MLRRLVIGKFSFLVHSQVLLTLCLEAKYVIGEIVSDNQALDRLYVYFIRLFNHFFCDGIKLN